MGLNYFVFLGILSSDFARKCSFVSAVSIDRDRTLFLTYSVNVTVVGLSLSLTLTHTIML